MFRHAPAHESIHTAEPAPKDAPSALAARPIDIGARLIAVARAAAAEHTRVLLALPTAADAAPGRRTTP